MFYIHHTACISPQQTFDNINIEQLHDAVNNKLLAIEPAPQGIPPGILRRMGRAIRMGLTSAMSILQKISAVDGIIIGTSKGGMEDCIKFLNQIMDYEEGMLTPANFVQSTPNATAGQLGLLTKNKCYNITHVHRGLAFENAVLDAAMQVKDHPGSNYLVGSVEEISDYNYNIEWLGGWYKNEEVSNKNLYNYNSNGSIAGEGAAMFLVNDVVENAIAKLNVVKLFHTRDENLIKTEFLQLIEKFGEPDLFIIGESGDIRDNKYYEACELVIDDQTPVARYKHMAGEYPTSSAMATWLACHLLNSSSIPQHILKRGNVADKNIRNIFIYNTYKGKQHGFLVISKK